MSNLKEEIQQKKEKFLQSSELKGKYGEIMLDDLLKLQHKADMKEVISGLNKIKVDASNANKNDDFDYILTMQIGIDDLINTIKEKV